jgi:hypothetical protein
VTALDGIGGVSIAVVEFVVGQMGFEVDASWHAFVLQQHEATPYEHFWQDTEQTVICFDAYLYTDLRDSSEIHPTGSSCPLHVNRLW